MLSRPQLEEWYAAYGYAVHRRCARLLGSEADANDAVQEVFLRAWRYGETVHDAQAPLGWLYRVADRHCFDVLSRRRTTQPPPPVEARESAQPASPDWETSRALGQVLVACSERVRAVAVAYYVDGLTQEETAAALGVSRKTVKEKLAQFRQLGAQLLEPEASGLKETA